MPTNFAKTGLLLAVLTGILVAMGGLVGGATGAAIALVVAAAMNLFSLWQSDKLVLRMYGAEEVDEHSGGEFYAIDDLCTHDGGSLDQGELEGTEIECPRHGARFDVTNGRATCLPAVAPVRVYPVRIENGEIQIQVD